DAVYKKLFAPTPSTAYNVTRPSQHATTGRSYNPHWIPPCPACGGPRTFECQLMPNLITVLKRMGAAGKKTGKQSEVERRNELARVLLKQNPGDGNDGAAVKTGMEWGTLGDGEGKKEVDDCWREEFVLVQWE
ncbi:hypothetical protein FRB90_006270, partial [Tulasnella sp. 427]